MSLSAQTPWFSSIKKCIEWLERDEMVFRYFGRDGLHLFGRNGTHLFLCEDTTCKFIIWLDEDEMFGQYRLRYEGQDMQTLDYFRKFLETRDEPKKRMMVLLGLSQPKSSWHKFYMHPLSEKMLIREIFELQSSK